MEMINDLPPIFGVLGLVCAIIVFALMARYAEGEEGEKDSCRYT